MRLISLLNGLENPLYLENFYVIYFIVLYCSGSTALIFLIPANLHKSLLEQFKTSESEKPIEKTFAKCKHFSPFLLLLLSYAYWNVVEQHGRQNIVFYFSFVGFATTSNATLFQIESPFSDYWFVLLIYMFSVTLKFRRTSVYSQTFWHVMLQRSIICKRYIIYLLIINRSQK